MQGGWQQWRSLYRYLPFVLYFLRLLTSSLNFNQVFHLLFKTCFKQASTSSCATNYAFQSQDFFRNTTIFFWNFYLLLKMAQFLLLRSSKHCRSSYWPCLANWFSFWSSYSCLCITVFRDFLQWSTCWEIQARCGFTRLTEESPNPGQRKHWTQSETLKKGGFSLLPLAVTPCLYPT